MQRGSPIIPASCEIAPKGVLCPKKVPQRLAEDGDCKGRAVMLRGHYQQRQKELHELGAKAACWPLTVSIWALTKKTKEVNTNDGGKINIGHQTLPQIS